MFLAELQSSALAPLGSSDEFSVLVVVMPLGCDPKPSTPQTGRPLKVINVGALTTTYTIFRGSLLYYYNYSTTAFEG